MKYKASAIVSVYRAKPFIYDKITNLLKSRVPIKIILIECHNGKELKIVQNRINTEQFIRVIYPQRIPIWRAVNIGIQIADTPYIVQANTDDLVHPDAYKRQIAKLDEGYDIAYFNYGLTWGFKKDWKTASEKAYSVYKVPEKGYSPGNGLGPFPMWRKSLHHKHGLFDEKLEIFGDADFWTKLANDPETKWGKIDKVLGVYANRSNNLEKNKGLCDKDRKRIKQKRKNKSLGEYELIPQLSDESVCSASCNGSLTSDFPEQIRDEGDPPGIDECESDTKSHCSPQQTPETDCKSTEHSDSEHPSCEPEPTDDISPDVAHSDALKALGILNRRKS